MNYLHVTIFKNKELAKTLDGACYIVGFTPFEKNIQQKSLSAKKLKLAIQIRHPTIEVFISCTQTNIFKLLYLRTSPCSFCFAPEIKKKRKNHS